MVDGGRLRNDGYFRFSKDLEESFGANGLLKSWQDLTKNIYGFFSFKKVKITEKADAHVHAISILNDNSIPAIFLRHKV